MRSNRGHHDSHNHPPSAEAAPRLACLQVHAQHMDDKAGRGNGCCIRIQKQYSESIRGYSSTKKNQRIFIDEEKQITDTTNPKHGLENKDYSAAWQTELFDTTLFSLVPHIISIEFLSALFN